MKFGFIALPICNILGFIALSKSQTLAIMSFIFCGIGVICYVFGSYLFSKLTHSKIFIYNIIRFGLIVSFLLIDTIVINFFFADIFGVVIVLFLFCIFWAFWIYFENKIAKELSYTTKSSLFLIAFWVGIFSSIMMMIVALFMAFGIMIGADLQYILAIITAPNGIKLFITENPIVFIVYCLFVVVIYVSFFASILLYGVAYCKISQAQIQ